MVATLFLTFRDIEMSGLISKDSLPIIELRAQIRSLESSPWFEGSRASAKLAGGSEHQVDPHQGDEVENGVLLYSCKVLFGLVY